MPTVGSTVLAALSASAFTHFSVPEGVRDASVRAVLAGLNIAANEPRRPREDLAIEDEKLVPEPTLCLCPVAEPCPAPVCDATSSEDFSRYAGAGLAAAGISAGAAIAGWRRGGRPAKASSKPRHRRARRGLASEATPAR